MYLIRNIYCILSSIVIIILICIIIHLICLAPVKAIMTNPSLSGAYLNYSSTNPTYTGRFNPSDLAYDQNLQLRYDIADIEIKIKKLINAPANAKVIINSGATESIANCLFWAKSYSNYGSILGTAYDHSAVEDNCKNLDLQYSHINSRNIDDKCSMIFLTHVNSKTGEVLDIPTFVRNFNTYTFLSNSSNNLPNLYTNHVLQYKPLLVLDATQSIMKVPIDMERWGLNAVFFSLHKIGGPSGVGVLVVNDTKDAPFKPLITGKQQNALRGGTLPIYSLIDYSNIFDNFDDFNSRKDVWNSTMQKLVKSGLKVYKPKGKHLYNTFLIATNDCPMGYINELSRHGIYVGNSSACKNEEIMNGKNSKNSTNENSENDNEGMKGGMNYANKDPFDSAIRISFKNANEINDDILDDIINTLRQKQDE